MRRQRIMTSAGSCGFCDQPDDDNMRTIVVDGQEIPVHAFHVERRPPHRPQPDAHNPERCSLCSGKIEGHAA